MELTNLLVGSWSQVCDVSEVDAPRRVLVPDSGSDIVPFSV